jgi:hypothetical protein
LADALLCLFEGVLLHMMPAAVRGWEALELTDSSMAAAGGAVGCGVLPPPGEGAAAVSCEAQQAGLAMFLAVVGVLQAVLDAGGAVSGQTLEVVTWPACAHACASVVASSVVAYVCGATRHRTQYH